MKQTSKQVQLLFVIFFIIFISTPFVIMLFTKDVKTMEVEKRAAYQTPSMKGSLKTIAKDITNYANDQFGGRSFFIQSWRQLNKKIFGQTNHSHAVLYGKHNWMFFTMDNEREIFENRTPLDEKTLAKICKILEQRRIWLKQQNIAYYLFIPPMPQTIYGDYLPTKLRKFNNFSKLDQLINYLSKHSKIKIIDVRSTLLKAKEIEKNPIYYHNDSHWNQIGALYGYQDLINTIEKDFPNVGKALTKNDFIWKYQKAGVGDLTQFITVDKHMIKRHEYIPTLKSRPLYKKIKPKFYPSYVSTEPIVRYLINNPKLPKMIMTRDSYCISLIPYLCNHFRESIYLWTPFFNPEIIKSEKPDIVVTEVLERLISNLELENSPLLINELKHNSKH